MLKFCSSQTAGSYQLFGSKYLISKMGKTLNWISSGDFCHILHTWDCCIVLLIPWCLCSQHVVVLHHCTDSLRHTLKMVTIHSMHHPPFDWVKIQLEVLKVLFQHTYHCDTTVNNNMSINWLLTVPALINLIVMCTGNYLLYDSYVEVSTKQVHAAVVSRVT